MELLLAVATGASLAAAAGLNAYVTLLLAAALARWSPVLRLEAPFDVLASGWVLAPAALLLALDAVLDKVPRLTAWYSRVGLTVRPLTGALLFASQPTALGDVHVGLELLAGYALAALLHGLKTAARPVIVRRSSGLGGVGASLAEDVAASLLVVAAAMMPLLGVALAAAAAALLAALHLQPVWPRPQPGS